MPGGDPPSGLTERARARVQAGDPGARPEGLVSVTTIVAGSRVEDAAVAALAARVSSDPIDGGVIWSTRHGMALAVLGRVLIQRGLPPLGPVSYSDRGSLSPMELCAGTRYAGQVDAVAAWARALGGDLVVEVPDPQVAVVHVVTVVEVAPDVRLRVWTATRPPTHDPLVDAVLGYTAAPR